MKPDCFWAKVKSLSLPTHDLAAAKTRLQSSSGPSITHKYTFTVAHITQDHQKVHTPFFRVEIRRKSYTSQKYAKKVKMLRLPGIEGRCIRTKNAHLRTPLGRPDPSFNIGQNHLILTKLKRVLPKASKKPHLHWFWAKPNRTLRRHQTPQPQGPKCSRHQDPRKYRGPLCFDPQLARCPKLKHAVSACRNPPKVLHR